MNLILASTSVYRQRLLERLQLPFTCIAPETDETHLPGEAPPPLAARLARAKAAAVAARHPEALVIGSDQVASLDGSLLGKPGSHRQAVAQLEACSGKTLHFYTAVSLLGPGIDKTHTEPFTVDFRPLGNEEIEIYLRRDTPYDCAGSFKWESLGIALFERLHGNDPTSLEGLPLIALTRLLAESGHPVLARASSSSGRNSES
ncbi:Maf family protein [Parahaliea aestuarii]|uniref:7-methyl-GTP pyrophosphatase n=1 Tax=Parahaliea aestuarii TaxID=1852021 RepID=A0A5C8ZRP7_9GAMM|nr:Maf family nucleotide pyrophosphatase [Parahaliea aestuarii]TXS91116.1 septum formation inhibitor Maf [Parahaliea aestuarii]